MKSLRCPKCNTKLATYEDMVGGIELKCRKCKTVSLFDLTKGELTVKILLKKYYL